MKKYLIILALALGMAVPSLATAAQFYAGDTYTIGKTERVVGDIYVGGERTTISGTVDGDVIAAGGTIVVDGTVAHDLTAVGGTLTITGTIQDDVRVGGGTVTIIGSIRGDLFVAGGEVNLSSSGSVDGDVIAAGGTLTIDGGVKGNVKAVGGKVRINAPIGGSVSVRVGELVLGSSALISGNLEYSAKSQATLEDGAQVRGLTTFTPVRNVDGREFMKAFLGFWFLVKMLAALVAALVLALVFPRYTRMVIEHARFDFAKDFLAGFITLFVAPILIVLCFVTLVGIPFAILGMLGYIALLVLAVLFTPIFLGSWLYMLMSKHDRMDLNWKTVLLGIAVLFVARWIPFLGGLISFVLLMILFGALVRIMHQKLWKNRS